MSKKINTNSNGYIIVYSIVMVLIVAFLLAFVSKVLQTKSDANVAIDKKSQILASLNIRNLPSEQIEAKYSEVIVADEVLNSNGDIVKEGKSKDADGFAMSSKDITEDCLPLYVCNVEGETKYVIPVYGMGLWGSLWGYISINSDGKTVFGAYFSHQSETAGVGALIAEEKFQSQFKDKVAFGDNGEVLLSVVKIGKKVEGLPTDSRCDAITGATLTSNGVDSMIKSSLKGYANIFKNKN
jgi:Na+-transporting NADH:ubiquinone oxidoreductase subunit C